MLKAIKNALGLGPKLDYKQALKNGAIIVDVRSKGEYAGGHIPGSVNIPVESLMGNLNKLKNKNQTIITCCASGMRSGSAKMMLKGKGYTDVHNGGSWFSLGKKIM
jgi:rhodanese-related sulfurtransferase